MKINKLYSLSKLIHKWFRQKLYHIFLANYLFPYFDTRFLSSSGVKAGVWRRNHPFSFERSELEKQVNYCRKCAISHC